MNRVTISMSAEAFLAIMTDPVLTVQDLRDKIRAELKKEPDGNTKRTVGRPLQAHHEHLTSEELKQARDLLFVQNRIVSDPIWTHPDTKMKPSRLAANQDGMDEDEVRLDNGVIAVLNMDLQDIPPMPRYE